MEKIDAIIKILLKLRRKTHNTLAFIVVTAGTALVSQKLWGPILANLLQKIDITIPDLRTEPYGVFLIMAGLFYHYIYSKNETGEFRLGNSDVVDHDAKILSRFMEIVDYERIREYFDGLWNDHSYYSQDSRALRQGARFLSLSENKFLSPNLCIQTGEFLRSCDNLLNFVAYSFFVYPNIRKNTNNNLRLCMYPDRNVDRGGSGDDVDHHFYSQKSDELDALLKTVKSNLDSFIEATKSELGAKAL
ncbi:MAG: hypothetical protein L3J33_05465 [Rhodobacteraceae bacterium]|nr:hypothetical protein [Paracoccaceae bacterium]